MDSGFGLNLEGFLVKGNLSLSSSDLPFVHGNGSIEGSGTLYINDIREYERDHGLTIQDILIKDGSIYIPYTSSSTELTNGSIITEGGITIRNTTNSTSITNGGSFTTLGGAAIKKDLIVGGYLDVTGNVIKNVALPFNGSDAANKDYVDSVASKLSGNFTAGQIIIGEDNGTAIKGYDTFTYDGNNLLIGGGGNITVQSTIDSFGNKLGGNIVIGGNTSLGGTVDIGGTLNLHNNKITGVQSPTNGSDAVTKDYVDNLLSNNISGNINNGEIVFGTVGGNIISSPLLKWDGLKISIHTSAQNSLDILGGIKIGGIIELDNKNIINLADPINDLDAVNKRTLDEVTDLVNQYEIVVGSTTANKLQSYPSLQYNGNTLTLLGGSNLEISTTSRSYSLTGNSSIITQGDISIYNNLYVGGVIDLNGNSIINVSNPVNGSDVATKEYVDNNKLSGNFTSGQLIIADNTGDSIRGYDNLTFTTNGTVGTLLLNNSTKLQISNTANATGLGVDGTLTSLGGASFLKNVYIGGRLDVNYQRITRVQDPIDDFDAVNKRYVDAMISENIENLNSFILENEITEPENINGFVFYDNTKAFISYIYVQKDNGDTSTFCLKGIKTQSNWFLSKTYIGDSIPVDFYITNIDNIGQIQYTNTALIGTTNIKFNTITLIKDEEYEGQININLTNANIFTDIPELEIINTENDASQLVIYVSDTFNNKHGMFILNCLLKENNWVINTYASGNITDLQFQIRNTGTSGIIQYKNTNSIDEYTFRVRQTKIAKNQEEVILQANTLVPKTIDNVFLSFDAGQYMFHVLAYVEVPVENKYAFYDIEGIYDNGIWKINTQQVGDRTNVTFSIYTMLYGYLQYTNLNSTNAIIKYYVDSPLVIPLPVKNGGTGQSYLSPNAVLRGNGIRPILASNDFIYENKVLTLGNDSSILNKNTTRAINLTTGGTITTYGGMSIGKNLIIGEELIVNGVDITPSSGDINQKEFFANNNQLIPDDITNFKFHNFVKSFIGMACVTIETTDSILDSLYELKGIHKQNGWYMHSNFIGDNVGIIFIMNTAGQVKYTSTNIPNWISTTMKFRATTTTL
jgi:hypothetical protein